MSQISTFFDTLIHMCLQKTVDADSFYTKLFSIYT